jgi:hypothetical protein
MEKNEYIKLGRKIFSRDPLRQHLKIRDDGSVLNSVTGELFNIGTVEQNILEAERASVAMPVSSVRFVSPTGTVTGGLGAAALESRVAAVNEFLSNATLEQLRELKLDRLFGKQVSGVQGTFAIKNNKTILESILDPNSVISRHLPGVTNITGEGLIRSSLRIAGEETPLSELEQLILLNKANATFLRGEAVNDFFDQVVASRTDPNALKKISKLVGKIPKRLQSELAPRDIESTTNVLSSALREMGVSSIKDIGKSFELTNITEIVLKMAKGDELSKAELRVAKTIGERKDAMQLIGRVSGLIGADPTENLDPYNVLNLLSEKIKDLSDPSGPSDSSIFKRLQDTIAMVKRDAGTALDRSRQALEYERVVLSLADNLEPIRDGAVLMTESFVQNLINQKVKEFKKISAAVRSSGPGTVNEEQLDLLRSLEGEIEKLRQALRSGTTADNTIRFGIGEEVTLADGTELGGTIKAKAGVLKFEDYEGNYLGLSYKQAKKENQRISKRIRQLKRLTSLTALEAEELEMLENETLPDVLRQFQSTSIIGDISAVKKETGTTQFLGMNVAMSSSEQVYVEPMELMAEPTLFTSQKFLSGQQEQITRSQEGIRVFLKTGKLPEEVRAFIEAQRRDLAGLDFEDLTSSAKGLVLKRRRELAEIDRIIALGLPLQESIPMINLVKSHFAKQSFTLKNDVPRLVVPSATRYNIRTPATSLQESALFADGGHTIVPIRTRSGKSEKATFVQFAVDGDQMYVSNENASVYKSVLSGFDLDDETIFQLRTFQDESGKMRLGGRIVRDPKSREEVLFAMPRFDSATTLQALLNKDPETITRLQSSIESDDFLREIMAETGVDESTARDTFQKLKNVLAKTDGKFSYKGPKILEVDESSLFTLETIVRKAKEIERGAPIESLQDPAEVVSFETAAEMRSASTRARNAIVVNDEGRIITQQAARGLDPEQAGPYLSERMVQITTVPGVDPDTPSKILREINNSLAELGYSSITLDELNDFAGSGSFKGIPTEVRSAIIHKAKLGLIRNVSAESIGDFAESIGSLANIGAGVESVSDILEEPEAFKTLTDSMSADALAKLRTETTVPVEPRSNIVDIINQSMGDKALRPYDEAIKGLTVKEQENLRLAYEAIARQVEKRTGVRTTYNTLGKYLQSDAAKAAISQQSEYLFAIRARQLAEEVAQDELVGFDPMVLSGRLRSVRAQIREAAINSYRSAISAFADKPEVQERIRAELSVLEAAKPEDALEMLALKKGSKLYNKYAATSIQNSAAQAGRAAIDIVTSPQIRMLTRKQLPTAKAEYIKAAREMIRVSGLSSSLEKLKELSEDPSRQTIYRIEKLKTSQTLAKGLRAIQQNYESTSSTTLDIVDAIESELRTNFGAAAARLLGDTGEEGAEHEMMSLFNAAKQRRDARRAMRDPASFGILQRAFREHTGDAGAAIESVTQDYARSFLEYQKSLDDLSPEKARSQHLMDFMEIMARDTSERPSVISNTAESGRTVAAEAYRFVEGREQLRALGEEAAASVARTVEPGDLDDVGTLADDIARSVTAGEDELFELARSGYKRISFDVFKSKNVRRGTAAAIALIGASFLYQSKKKKDHTAADIQGPPLLPGGNPYETNYPTRQSVINQIQENNVNSPGMQYQINTSGSIQDLNKLRGLFGDVVDGPINSTMYNGLPILGQDPYSDVASRF